MGILERVLARADADPAVLGVILTGSQARGTAGAWSDYDVVIVVAEQTVPWRHATRTAELDEVVCTPDALADTSVHWQRYAYRGARVLLDRLDGGIANLVERQAVLSNEEAGQHARTALDAYINQLYRAVKSHRDGRAEAAYLDEMESVPWLLETVFALFGRLRPYNKYLQWELEQFPLPGDWNAALMPERVFAQAFALFPAVEALARHHGHADVLDAWQSDIELIRTFAAGSRLPAARNQSLAVRSQGGRWEPGSRRRRPASDG
ncbi:nucleotidyltransferase domain-containing protein [Dactylosporangium sp. NPDC000244]|uniref:nucleotidyltransferase domain-containing protein n=1 Tax=Dactylosporangium sp. NPDC000244 TaxID=3154365 RepID=UPI003321BBA8